MILPVGLLLVAGMILYAGIHNMSVTDALGQLLGRPKGKPLGSLSGFDTSTPASGGSASAGSSGSGVLGGNLHLGRTDMGVDFTGSGPVPAVGSGTVTRVDPLGSGNGWPGGGGVVIKLDNPPSPDHAYTYLFENISPTVRVGQHVNKGDTIATAHGTYPYLEYGWASDAQGTTLSSAHGTQNVPNHSNTPEGISFRKWLGF